MSPFESFEKTVVSELLQAHLEPERITAVVETADQVSYQSTGGGYFLVVRHPALPVERVVCHEPLLKGSSAGIECGFIVFLENGELTLECHSWGDGRIPSDFRTRQVNVERAA